MVPLEIKQIKLCLDSLFAVGGINVKKRELLMIRTWNGLSKKTIFLQQCHRAADRNEQSSKYSVANTGKLTLTAVSSPR